jgi:hypothetical protein
MEETIMNEEEFKDMHYFEQLKNHLRRYRVTEQQEDPHTIEIVKNFFIEHPEPSDKDVHAFADKIGMPVDRLETIAYGLLSSLLQIGKHRDIPDEEFDQEELNKGIQVETEHSDIPEICKEIAKDHLAECPRYYSFLSKMEKECKGKK